MPRIVSMLTHCVKIDAVELRRDRSAPLTAVIRHLRVLSVAALKIKSAVSACFTWRLTKLFQLFILD